MSIFRAPISKFRDIGRILTELYVSCCYEMKKEVGVPQCRRSPDLTEMRFDSLGGLNAAVHNAL